MPTQYEIEQKMEEIFRSQTHPALRAHDVYDAVYEAALKSLTTPLEGK